MNLLPHKLGPAHAQENQSCQMIQEDIAMFFARLFSKSNTYKN